MSNNFQNHDLEQVRPILNTWTDFIGDLMFTDYMHEISAYVASQRSQANFYPMNGDYFKSFRATPISTLKIMKITQWGDDNQKFLAEQGFMNFALELSSTKKVNHPCWRRFTEEVLWRLSSHEILFWTDDLQTITLLKGAGARHIIPIEGGWEYVNRWLLNTHSTTINWHRPQ